jgi:opacity protein-like surface antigen
MKRRIFSLVVLFVVIIVSSGNAQKDKEFKENFIYGGSGVLTVPDVASFFEDFLLTIFTAGYAAGDTKLSVPALHFGYQRYSSEKFGYGVSVTYQQLSKDILFNGKSTGTFKRNFTTVMAEASLDYAKSESFCLFLEIGAGACLYSEDANYDGKSLSDSKTTFALQFTPLGLRLGKNFKVNIGIGVGFKGTLTGSLGYKF